MRSHGGHTEARPKVHGRASRQWYGLLLGNHCPLSSGSPAASRGEPDPHLLANPEWIDAVADGIDDPRSILVRYLEPVDRPRRRARSGLVIGRVDP